MLMLRSTNGTNTTTYLKTMDGMDRK